MHTGETGLWLGLKGDWHIHALRESSGLSLGNMEFMGLMVTFLRQLCLTGGVIGALLGFCAFGSVISDLIPRDPAFRLPHPASRQGVCHSCNKEDQLDLVENDKAVSSINLNMYGPDEFTRDVLVMEHGHPGFTWNPHSVYTLVPKGRHNSVNEVTAFLQRTIVIFKISKDEESGEVEITCTSHPEINISRHDNRIRITLGRGAQFDFEADDIFGQTWRLASLSHAASNWQTSFEYEEGKMTGILYPDGQRATIAYEGDHATQITYPSGDFVKLGRDVAGYISSVDFFAKGEEKERKELVSYSSYTDERGQEQTKAIYRTVTDKAKPTLMKRYLYENDARGRIKRFVDSCSRSTRVEFLDHTGADGIREMALVATDETSGDYQFMRHRVVDNKQSWIIDKGYGKAGTAMEEATLSKRRILSHMKDRWKTQYAWNSGNGGQRTIYDPSTREPQQIIRDDGRTTNWRREIIEDNLHLHAKKEDGSEVTMIHNKHGNCLSYKSNYLNIKNSYDAKNRLEYENVNGSITHLQREPVSGLVLKASTHDGECGSAQSECVSQDKVQTFEFTYDNLQRVVTMTASDGTTTSWSRDTQRRIIRKAWTAAGEDETLVVHTTSYGYDEQGKLSRITYGDGTYEAVKQSCNGISKYIDRQKLITSYSYDDQNRLIRSKNNREEFRYAYNERGDHSKTRFRKVGEEWKTFDERVTEPASPPPEWSYYSKDPSRFSRLKPELANRASPP